MYVRYALSLLQPLQKKLQSKQPGPATGHQRTYRPDRPSKPGYFSESDGDVLDNPAVFTATPA